MVRRDWPPARARDERMSGGGIERTRLLAELHGKPDLERLRTEAAELRRAYGRLEGDVADLLQHLRGRMEAAQGAIRAGDPATAFEILTGEVRALEKSFLAGGDAGAMQ